MKKKHALNKKEKVRQKIIQSKDVFPSEVLSVFFSISVIPSEQRNPKWQVTCSFVTMRQLCDKPKKKMKRKKVISVRSFNFH